MAMNSEAKHGGSGGGDLETRVTVIEKTMLTVEVFQHELAALRDEMRVGFGEIRQELVEIRKEMQVGFADVRKEMQVGFAGVRKEIQAQDGALRVEIAKTHVEIAKTPFETFKWLLAAGGLAAAIATAIYNIWFR
jgi:hypothetical protein